MRLSQSARLATRLDKKTTHPCFVFIRGDLSLPRLQCRTPLLETSTYIGSYLHIHTSRLDRPEPRNDEYRDKNCAKPRRAGLHLCRQKGLSLDNLNYTYIHVTIPHCIYLFLQRAYRRPLTASIRQAHPQARTLEAKPRASFARRKLILCTDSGVHNSTRRE